MKNVLKSNSDDDQPGNPKETVQPQPSLQAKGEVLPQQRVRPHLHNVNMEAELRISEVRVTVGDV